MWIDSIFPVILLMTSELAIVPEDDIVEQVRLLSIFL